MRFATTVRISFPTAVANFSGSLRGSQRGVSGIGGLKRRGQQPAHPLPLFAVVLIKSEIDRTPVPAELESPGHPIPEGEDDGVIAVSLESHARVVHSMNGRCDDQG